MKILISFLIVLFINNSILANNYSQCILDNMKDITSDSAANAIREACWALYPKEKKKVTKEKCERVPYSNSKWSFDEISTKYVPKPEWGALIGGSFQQNCKSIGDQFWMAGFLASCSQYGNKVYYLTFTNEGDKEALAFFQYKKNFILFFYLFLVSFELYFYCDYFFIF